MNNINDFETFVNEKSMIYRIKRGENPLKRDKTPVWDTKEENDKYFVRSPRGGEWLQISKHDFVEFNKDREARFGKK